MSRALLLLLGLAGCASAPPPLAYPGAPPADIARPELHVAVGQLEARGFSAVVPLGSDRAGALRFAAKIPCGRGPRDEPLPPCPTPEEPEPVRAILRFQPLGGGLYLRNARGWRLVPWLPTAPSPDPAAPYRVADPALAARCCAREP